MGNCTGMGIAPSQTTVIYGSGQSGSSGGPQTATVTPLELELKNPRWKHKDTSKQGDAHVGDELTLEVDIVVKSGTLTDKKMVFHAVDTSVSPPRYVGATAGDVKGSTGTATWKVTDVYDIKEERAVSVEFRAQLRGIYSPMAKIPVESFLELNLHFDDLSPAEGAPYKVVFANGAVRTGNLDSNGYARLENVPNRKAEIVYGDVHKPLTLASVKAQTLTDEGIAADLRKLGLDPENVDIRALVQEESWRTL